MVVDTPGYSVVDEERAGADVVLYYGLTLYAAYAGVRHTLARFKEEKDANRLADVQVDAQEFERFVGYDDFAARTVKYAQGRPDGSSDR